MGPSRIIGTAYFSDKLLPMINDDQDIGSSTLCWKNIYAGEFTISKTSTTAQNYAARLSFINTDSTTTRTQNNAYIAVYNTHVDNTTGAHLVLSTTSSMFICAGTYAPTLYTSVAGSSAVEFKNLYLIADADIYIEGNGGNNIANRKGIKIANDAIIPSKGGAPYNGNIDLGTYEYLWGTLYAHNIALVADDLPYVTFGIPTSEEYSDIEFCPVGYQNRTDCGLLLLGDNGDPNAPSNTWLEIDGEFYSHAIIPVDDNTYNIGASDLRYANIYATSFIGSVPDSVDIGTGDKLIIADYSDNGKLKKTNIQFDGTTVTKALTQKGTWETVNNYTHPTGDGNSHIPATGTTNEGLYLRAGATANSATWSAPTVWKGNCTTAAATVIKDVTCPNFPTGANLAVGTVIFVTFTKTNSGAVANIKLRVNSNADGDAKPIKYLYNGDAPANIPAVGYLRANQTYYFTYDGTNWVVRMHYNTNTDTKPYGVRVYRDTVSETSFNNDYPLLISRSLASAIASTYSNNVYGTINNSDATKIPTYNPYTGEMKVPSISSDVTGSLYGNADTATTLETSREIYVNLTGTRDANNKIKFDGSADKAISVSGILPISHGGLGSDTFTNDYVIVPTGTSQVFVSRGLKVTGDAGADVTLEPAASKTLTLQTTGTASTANMTISSGYMVFINKPTTASIIFTSGGADESHEVGRFNTNGYLVLGKPTTPAPNNATTQLWVYGAGTITNGTAASDTKGSSQLSVCNQSGTSVAIELRRGAFSNGSGKTSWQIINDGGSLIFRNDYTAAGAQQSTYNQPALDFTYNTKIATFYGNVKPNATNTLELGASDLRWAYLYVTNIDASGNATITGNVSAGGTLTVTGASTLNNTLTVTGVATFNGNVAMNSSVSAGALTAGSLVVSGNSSLVNTTTTSTILPSANESYNIGASENKYLAVYAGTFYGGLSGNASTATEFSSGCTVKLTGNVTGTSSSSTKGWEIATTIANSAVTNAMLAGDITKDKLQATVLKVFSRTNIGTSPAYDDPGVNGFFEVRNSSEVTGATGTVPENSFYGMLSLKTDDNTTMMQLAGSNTNGWWIRGKQGGNITLTGVAWQRLVVADGGTYTITASNATDAVNATNAVKADKVRLQTSNTAFTDTTTVALEGISVRWYSQSNTFSGQPAQWGFLVTIAGGDSSQENHQIFIEQSNGGIYHRGTNGSSYNNPPAFRRLWSAGDSVTSAVWNDYAEYRNSKCTQPGRIVMENGDDTLSATTERLQHFAGIISDTWGFAQGETETAKTPLAVAGRVLAYTFRPREIYKPGDCVCAAPGGTVDIMTREEIVAYPDRIVGTVSCVPDYTEWGGGDRDPVKVNGRIWIKVR